MCFTWKDSNTLHSTNEQQTCTCRQTFMPLKYILHKNIFEFCSHFAKSLLRVSTNYISGLLVKKKLRRCIKNRYFKLESMRKCAVNVCNQLLNSVSTYQHQQQQQQQHNKNFMVRKKMVQHKIMQYHFRKVSAFIALRYKHIII